ncbi:hypothetical protein OIU79_013670 [Salix purpurea]|uniref:Uncharacterized protein n=1 Tax=Salix purpurea TaxID=77065 RepID=A0A9Q0PNU6_SALPP|nr:hypothetical protein OIU79_013670 [Salix purpurea]
MRTRHRPIRWFPSCPCTWPIRYKSRVDFSALTRTENAGLLKPQTCYAYPSLHDTWLDGSRRWHMTKHLDFIRLHVTQVAQHRGWLGDSNQESSWGRSFSVSNDSGSSKRKAVSKRHLP